ncbi:MAG: PD40 domain-containing protein, partial [Anaerolineales bacterium]
ELLEGVVRISAQSIFTVKECTTRRGILKTTLSLEEGRLWAHLAPGQPHAFTVETASAVAAVRDTDFSIQVAPDRTTLVSVATGEVALTAQGQSVTVAAGQQASVQENQPPAEPEPMSDQERALWATEGEMPELAPPTPTPAPTPTPPKVDMGVDVYCALTGPAGDPASRDPGWTILEARAQGQDVAQMRVETPSGESMVLPAYGDLYGQEHRFLRTIQGLPQAGGTYIFTALDAEGEPIPGAVASDVFLGGYEPDPPANARAEVVEAGIRLTWDPAPVIPGAFDPGRSPSLGFYQITLNQEGGGMVYGWNNSDRPLSETTHLIPLRGRDLGPSDFGQALESLQDGAYFLNLDAFSVAPEGAPGAGLECSANDPANTIRVLIQGGQARISEAGYRLFDCETPPLVCIQRGYARPAPLDNSSGLYFRMGAWSPDGQQVVVVGNSEGDPNAHGPNALYIVSVDGSGLTQLTRDQRNNVMPAWSPDGTSIAYHSNGDLARISPDGSGAQILVAGGGCSTRPAWSPDSQRIAFLVNPAGCISHFPWNTQIWIVNRDGSAPTRLAGVGPEESADDVVWTPDGQVIYYLATTQSGSGSWHSMAPDGSSQPVPAQEPPASWRNDFWPHWQP